MVRSWRRTARRLMVPGGVLLAVTWAAMPAVAAPAAPTVRPGAAPPAAAGPVGLPRAAGPVGLSRAAGPAELPGATPGAAAAAGTVSIQPDTEDASVESLPNYLPYAGDRLLIGGGGTMSWRAALRFDLSAVPAGAVVTSAKLGLYYDGYCVTVPGVPFCGGVDHPMDAHRVTAPWTTSTASDRITYDPAAAGSYTLVAGAPQGWMTWPVTSLVQAWRAGTPNYGLLVGRHTESPTSSGPAPRGRRSTGSGGLLPRLVVSYASDAVDLLAPTTVHARGAELHWTPYAGTAPFTRYEVHRGTSPSFVPTAATRLATITDPAVTAYRDTTGTPGQAVSYRVVAGTAVSAAQSVTLPPAGQARTTLRPGPAGKVTFLYYSTELSNCANYGAMQQAWVGTAVNARWRAVLSFDVSAVPATSTVVGATLSLWRLYGPSAAAVVQAHRVTGAWGEGTGNAACTGDGATWYEADGGRPWTVEGGDYDPAPAGSAGVPGGGATGSTSLAVTGLVQGWVSGAANNGVLLRVADETLRAGNAVVFATDDYSAEPALRPTLTVTYTE